MPSSLSRSHTFLLVRHGITRFSGTYCGSTNPPLTGQGHRQAKAVARLLKPYAIDHCYVSPLQRAQQTAKILLARRQIVLRTDPSLQELRFGAWEGLTFQEVERKWPALVKKWMQNPTGVRIPEAETFVSLRRRIKRFLNVVHRQCLGRTILFVAHGGSLSAIVLELLGLPDREFFNYFQPAGSIRIIERGEVQTLC